MTAHNAAFGGTKVMSGDHRRKLSPLAHGIGYRLAWAGGLSVLLWLAVFWALS